MTGWLDHLRCPRWIALHFGPGLSAADERRMRRHLYRCQACRDLYDAQLLLEGEGAEAAARRRARLARALLSAPPRAAWSRRRVLGVALATAAAAGLLVVALPRLSPQPEFRAKGGGARDEGSRFVSVTVYARAGGSLKRVGHNISPGQGLAFAYTNGSKRRFDRLMIFAVNERHEVYWYYPAWVDPATDPAAVPIHTGRGVELPQEVAHSFVGQRLRLFALFTRRRDLTVRKVERVVDGLRRRGVAAVDLVRFPLANTAQHNISLRIVLPPSSSPASSRKRSDRQHE